MHHVSDSWMSFETLTHIYLQGPEQLELSDENIPAARLESRSPSMQAAISLARVNEGSSRHPGTKLDAVCLGIGRTTVP
jgi:hypothetical protein